jgi:hypothetical protein
MRVPGRASAAVTSTAAESVPPKPIPTAATTRFVPMWRVSQPSSMAPEE